MVQRWMLLMGTMLRLAACGQGAAMEPSQQRLAAIAAYSTEVDKAVSASDLTLLAEFGVEQGWMVAYTRPDQPGTHFGLVTYGIETKRWYAITLMRGDFVPGAPNMPIVFGSLATFPGQFAAGTTDDDRAAYAEVIFSNGRREETLVQKQLYAVAIEGAVFDVCSITLFDIEYVPVGRPYVFTSPFCQPR